MRLLRVMLLIAVLSSCDAIAGSSLRLLFIGNSYLAVNNVPGLLADLARNEDRRLDYVSVLGSGFTLENHWNAGDTTSAIRRGNWDVVVLQAQSLQPVEHTVSYFEFVRLFNVGIRRIGARTVLHSGWARKDFGNPLELQSR